MGSPWEKVRPTPQTHALTTRGPQSLAVVGDGPSASATLKPGSITVPSVRYPTYSNIRCPDDLPSAMPGHLLAAAAPVGSQARTSGTPPTGNRGVTGLDVRNGRIMQEYNTDLQTLSTRMIAYEQMRRSDPAFAAMEALITLPVLQAQYRVVAGDDTAFADFVEWNLNDGLTHSLSQTLRTAILAVMYGFSWHYKRFEQKPQGYWGWRSFAERERATVYQWKFDGDGSFDGLVQYGRDPATGQMVTTDYATDELIVWTWRGEAGNPEGMGAFRQAYKPYKYKEAFEEFAAIRIERQACGLPMATGPEMGYDETEEQNVHEQLSNLRTAHDAGIVVPSGWTVEFLDLGGADVPFESHIERQHSAMLQTILAQFVGLGSGGDSGAYALSRDSSNLFLMSLEAIADWMCETFNRYAIPQLAGYNGAVDGEKMPKLAHGKVGVRDMDRFTRAIRNVFDSKVVLPPEVDAYVREELGLPEATQTTADVPGNPANDTGSQVNDEEAAPMRQAPPVVPVPVQAAPGA